MFWRPHHKSHETPTKAEGSEPTVVESGADNAATLATGQRQDTAHDRALRDLGISATSTSAAPGVENESSSKADAPSAFSSRPEDIYDPATGTFAGTIRSSASQSMDVSSPPSQQTPTVQSPRSVSGPAAINVRSPAPSMAETTQQQQPKNSTASSSDDMWNQLSKIRVLQSDIARMHFALDKTGIVDGVKGRRGAGPSTARDDTTGTRGGRDQTASTEQLSPIVEDEFARRKASIGAIMSKLDALSVAVTEFHTLPTPPLDLPSPSTETSSRANSLQASERRIFSEPSQMSNVSTTRAPSAAGSSKDPFKSTTANTAGTSLSVAAPTRRIPSPLAINNPLRSAESQRLETLYEPVERVIDGIPSGNFQVTSHHDSPPGTPTSLVPKHA